MVQYRRASRRNSLRGADRTLGTLFVVATPIGNLEDVTRRALRVLREADLIAAEDTRRTAKLLRHYEITTGTTSLHEHNERQKIPTLLARLAEGQKVALVSDAGTPLVSDPGARLLRAALDAGHRVEVIPGPSAVITALVASGLPLDEFTFVGFPPNRSNARTKWLRGLAGEPRTLVFFEAPHRIRQTLEDAREIWGDREVAICRELTKVHEELVKGPITTVLERLEEPRGEFTVVARGASAVAGTANFQAVIPSDEAIYDEFCHMTDNGASRREIVSILALKYGRSSKSMYQTIERGKRRSRHK